MDVHYPDLIRAADVLLTKPGYSTAAEAMAHGTPLAYASRGGFRESPLLEDHLRRHWPSVALTRQDLEDGSWVEPALALAGSQCPAVIATGAKQAVEAIKAAAGVST